MFSNKLMAASAAFAFGLGAVAPAVAEELVQHATTLPDGSQIVVVEYRTGGVFRNQTRSQTRYRCPPQGAQCELEGEFDSASPGAAAYISPVAAAAVFGASIRPTRIEEGDVNVQNGSSSSSSAQGGTATAAGGVAVADADANANPVAIADAEANPFTIASSDSSSLAIAEGGDGGDALAVGVGLGGDAEASNTNTLTAHSGAGHDDNGHGNDDDHDDESNPGNGGD